LHHSSSRHVKDVIQALAGTCGLHWGSYMPCSTALRGLLRVAGLHSCRTRHLPGIWPTPCCDLSGTFHLGALNQRKLRPSVFARCHLAAIMRPWTLCVDLYQDLSCTGDPGFLAPVGACSETAGSTSPVCLADSLHHSAMAHEASNRHTKPGEALCCTTESR